MAFELADKCNTNAFIDGAPSVSWYFTHPAVSNASEVRSSETAIERKFLEYFKPRRVAINCDNYLQHKVLRCVAYVKLRRSTRSILEVSSSLAFARPAWYRPWHILDFKCAHCGSAPKG